MRSKWSSSARIEFIINLFVVAKDVWEECRLVSPHWGDKPAANYHYGRFDDQRFLNVRIEVPPANGARSKETWWSVDAGSSIRPIAARVLAAIRDYAVPAIRDRVGQQS
jgi:hypothetical protein